MPPFPPKTTILPGAYITALLVVPTFTGFVVLGGPLNTPLLVMAPFPAGSKNHICSAEIPKTLPLGATNAFG